jgi:hypothetical protein
MFMENRGFVLTVALILVAAMFASNFGSNPTGNALFIDTPGENKIPKKLLGTVDIRSGGAGVYEGLTKEISTGKPASQKQQATGSGSCDCWYYPECGETHTPEVIYTHTLECDSACTKYGACVVDYTCVPIDNQDNQQLSGMFLQKTYRSNLNSDGGGIIKPAQGDCIPEGSNEPPT